MIRRIWRDTSSPWNSTEPLSILAKAAGGIFHALPLRHLPWWPGRVAYPSDQCIPFGLQVLSSVKFLKTIFFHLKTIFIRLSWGHKYASFRWVHSDLVRCHFKMEELDTVFYGGHNFTDYVKGNESHPSKAHRIWKILTNQHGFIWLRLISDSFMRFTQMWICFSLVWRHLKWSLPSTRMPLWSSLGKMSVVWPIPALELAFACPAPTTSSLEALGRCFAFFL